MMGITHSLSDRANCVKHEGLIKGLFWCDSDPKTRTDIAKTHVSNFIQGTLWPIQLVRYFSGSKNAQHQEKYLCHEMISDIRSGTKTANRRMLSHFRNEIFATENSELIQKMGRYAQAYYRHNPSRLELSDFSEKSINKSKGICSDSPLLSVEQALLISAENLVKNYKETKLFKPNINQPHEYLSITGYGPNGKEIEKDTRFYTFMGLKKYQENFPIGEGKCIKHLKNMSADRIKLSMRRYNTTSTFDSKSINNNTPITHVRLQCVEALGMDNSCIQRFVNMAKKIKDPQNSANIMLVSVTACDKVRAIGVRRTVSLGKYFKRVTFDDGFAEVTTTIANDSDHVIMKDSTGRLTAESHCQDGSGTYNEIVAFLREVQTNVSANDKRKVISLIGYPLRVNDHPSKTIFIRSERQLLANYSTVFTPTVVSEINDYNPNRVFCRRNMTMGGAGVIWAQKLKGKLKIMVVNK